MQLFGFFYLSLGLVWLSEIEISLIGKNNENPVLVCEKENISPLGSEFNRVLGKPRP